MQFSAKDFSCRLAVIQKQKQQMAVQNITFGAKCIMKNWISSEPSNFQNLTYSINNHTLYFYAGFKQPSDARIKQASRA